MKALVYEEYCKKTADGAPDDDYKKILQVKEIDDPKPKPDEVVFKVKAAALNYNDLWGMRGEPDQCHYHTYPVLMLQVM